MDTELAVIDALYQQIVNDPEMGTLSGRDPVPLHLLFAPQDSPFPYMTHRLEITSVEDVVVPALYRLDVWDHGTSAQRVYDLRRRIITLLDGQVLNENDLEASHIRLAMQSGGLVGTDTVNVWRYGLVFACRFSRPGEIARIHGS